MRVMLSWSPPPPPPPRCDRDLLLGLESLLGKRQGEGSFLVSTREDGGCWQGDCDRDREGGPNPQRKGDKNGDSYCCEHQVCREALALPPPPLLTPLLTPLLLSNHPLLDEDDRDDVSRPVLHPPDPFSSPLSTYQRLPGSGAPAVQGGFGRGHKGERGQA